MERFKNFSLFFVSLIVSLLLAEMIIRWFAPVRALGFPAIYKDDSLLGYCLKPNIRTINKSSEYETLIKTNSIGLRNKELEPKQTRRILVLGDSFTFGGEVNQEKLFTSVIERKLQSQKHDVEIINAGVSGYSLAQEYRYLERSGLQLQPDFIVVGVSLLNDLFDTGPFLRRIERNDRFTVEGYLIGQVDFSSWLGQLKFWLKSSSHLYQRLISSIFVNPKIYSILTRYRIIQLPAVEEFESQMSFNLGEPLSAKTLNDLQMTLNSLQDMYKLSQQHQIPIVFVLLPMKYQIDDQVWDVVKNSVASPKADRLRHQKVLTSFFQKNKIMYFDLTPMMHQIFVEKKEPLYWLKDSHWNSDGHRVAGYLLTDYLETKIKTLNW